MIRLLFYLFGPAILRHIEQTRKRPQGFDGMEYAYTMGSKEYWTWVDITSMPASRQKHIERALKFADAHISPETLDTLCTMMEEHLAVGMKRGKDADKALLRVAHISQELRRRPKDIIPEEVFYDLCAIFVAREGEDPRTFDPAIHHEKVQAITEAGRAGHDFFTQPPALRRLLGSSLTTAQAFADLQTSWMAERLNLKALVSLHSSKPSKSLATSTPSPT